MEINLILFRLRKLGERREQISSAPELGDVAVLKLLELDEESALVRTDGVNGESRRVMIAARFVGVGGGGQFPAGVAPKNTTAGREDHVRRICERLDENFAANSLCLTNQPDESVVGLRGVSRRLPHPLFRRWELLWR